MLILLCRGKPYVIVFVGVNGVGKSTNLAKIAYWLVQNKMKVCKSKPCVSLLVHIPQQVAQPPRNVMHWTPDPICTACSQGRQAENCSLSMGTWVRAVLITLQNYSHSCHSL